MLETAGNSRDETHTPTMLYSLGRKLGHCVPGEEWYFNEIPLPVACRMTERGEAENTSISLESQICPPCQALSWGFQQSN